ATVQTPDEGRRRRGARLLQRVEAEQTARPQVGVVGRFAIAAIEESGHDAVLVQAEPGAAGLQILAAHDLRVSAEEGRGQRRPGPVFVAVRGDYDRDVGEPSIVDGQRAHPLPTCQIVPADHKSWRHRAVGYFGPDPLRRDRHNEPLRNLPGLWLICGSFAADGFPTVTSF